MHKLYNFIEARERLTTVVVKTKLMHSPVFSEESGNEIYLKPENLQKTGSFKIRGAYNKIAKLTEEEKKKAGSDYVPLQDITITKATLDGSEIDVGSITMSNLKNFSAEYNLSGNKTDKNGSIFSGLFKKNIGVSAVIPTYDFVDGEGKYNWK